MKNIFPITVIFAAVITTGCSTIGTKLAKQAANNFINNKFKDKPEADTLVLPRLIGTWQYVGPGCEIKDNNSLVNEGGKILANGLKDGLKPSFDKMGITASNTNLTINKDGSYTAVVCGKSISGTYSFDAKENTLTLQGVLFNAVCHAMPGDSITSFLFESKKFQKLMKITSLLSSKDSQAQDFSTDYASTRIGFDMIKSKP